MDTTKRFSDRVDNYVKYRPRYPTAIIDFLRNELGLAEAMTIADIGSGTGFLSERFLVNGNLVIGVEPNHAMREAGDVLLQAYTNFKSVDGTAEATTLVDNSIDYVVAGQAFHWFDVVNTRKEFKRILKPKGYVVLVWNSRRLDAPLMQAYEDLLHEFADDYKGVSERNADDIAVEQFYAPSHCQLQTFDNVQIFGFDGLKGRALSSSYSPNPEHPNHERFIEQLRKIFEQYQIDGKVRIEYITRLYYGALEQ